jgi:hypothetical protein
VILQKALAGTDDGAVLISAALWLGRNALTGNKFNSLESKLRGVSIGERLLPEKSQHDLETA